MLRFTLKFNTIISLLFFASFLALGSAANDLNNNTLYPSEEEFENPKQEVVEVKKTYPDVGAADIESVSESVNNKVKSKGYAKSVQAFDKSINILASSSLTNVMQRVIHEYSVDNNISVSVSFDSNSELLYNIESGELADVYLSDAPSLQDAQQKGLIDGFNIYSLYKDSLVVVAPKNHHLLAKIAGVTDPRTVLEIVSNNDIPVIADPDTDPAGFYTREALEKYGLWNDLSRKLFRAANTRVALYLISKGNRAGIVYLSDALSDSNVEILAEIDDNAHSPIVYKGAVVAGENMVEARKFLNYLQSDEAAKIFAKYGLKENE
jgi:molybdate transport system substrate-binding protein